MEHTIGIYTICDLIKYRVYVGSSLRCERRIKRHIYHLNKGDHDNKYLQNAWKKYGQGNFIFDIVEKCLADERFVREQWWINYYNSSNLDSGFNLAHSVVTQYPSPYKSQKLKEVWTEEMRHAMSERSKEMHKDPKFRAISLDSLSRGRDKTNLKWYDPDSKVRKVREENLRKGSDALAKLMNDPEWLASRKTGSRTKELWDRPEYREKMTPKLREGQKKGAAAIKQKWDTDTQYREERISALRKAADSPEFKQRHQEKLKKFWSDPEYRAKHSARIKARWEKYRQERANKDIV